MGEQRSTISLLIEAKDKGLGLLKSLRDQLTGAKKDTESLAASQEKAAEATSELSAHWESTATTIEAAERKVFKAALEATGSIEKAAIALDDYRRGLNQAADASTETAEATTELDAAEKKLTGTQDDLKKSTDRVSVSGGFLEKIFRRLVAAALLFVSARAIKQFFVESVKLFVENQKEASGLRERIEALGTSWKSLKIAVGAWIVASTSADAQGGILQTTVDGLRKKIVDNWEAWVHWGRVIVESLVLVANGFKQVFDLTVNGWQQMRFGAELAFLQIKVGFKNLLNEMQDEFESSNFFAPQRFLNRVLGGDQPGRRTFQTGQDEARIDELIVQIAGLNESGGFMAQLREFMAAARAGRARVNAPIGPPPGGFRVPGEAGAAKARQPEVLDFEKLRMEQFLRYHQSQRLGGGPGGPVRVVRRPFQGLGTDETGGFPGLGGELPTVSAEGAGFGAHFQLQAEEASEAIGTIDEAFAELAVGGLLRFGEAYSDTIADIISGSTSVGEALRRSVLGAVAQIAAAKGQLYGAEALAALAVGDGPGAAKLLAASTAMFTLAGALKGIGGRGGGGGGGGGAVGGGGLTTGGLSLENQRDQAGRNDQGITLEIHGDPTTTFDWSKPSRVDAFVEMMERVSGRRVTVVRR